MSRSPTPSKAREVTQLVPAQRAMDGAGVRIGRSLGTRALSVHDPFLLLDEFKSDDANDYIAGFPPHPHRGFETVTYMLAGSIEHKDSRGNTGRLGPGDVQWMTAARGIVHSEMPKQHDGLMWGFQLWVNLPAAEKMNDPAYQDIASAEIPEVELDGGGAVRVIAGRFRDVSGPIQIGSTEPVYLDLRLQPGEVVEVGVPAGHNALAYAYEGSLFTGPEGATQPLRTSTLAVLDDGDHVRIEARSQPGRALLLAGRPIGEPVARHGPFVMNTVEELEQAFLDYRSGRLTD